MLGQMQYFDIFLNMFDFLKSSDPTFHMHIKPTYGLINMQKNIWHQSCLAKHIHARNYLKTKN